MSALKRGPGRPIVIKDSTRLVLGVPAGMLEELRGLAFSQDVSCSSYIRDILQAHLDNLRGRGA